MLALFVGVAACGGGGAKGPATDTPPDPSGAGTAASIQLLVSTSQVGTDGTSTIDVTAVVLDASNLAISDKKVAFQVTDPNLTAFLSGITATTTTDANGSMKATLNIGSNHGNRTINLTATADGATGSNQVDVTGTVLTINGANSLVTAATTPLTISLKDSTGQPIKNASVTVSSTNGNGLSPATGTTSTSGELVVNVTGTIAGTDTVTATAFGATASITLAVSGSDFTFTTPAQNTEVVVSTPQTIQVRWIENGTPQSSRIMQFSSTRGTLSANSVLTDGSGVATLSINSNSAGNARVTATGAGGVPAASLNLVFVTTSANAINVQADKTTLPINALGETTSRATIIAVVRDAANNLVKNAQVEFQITTDTTGGTLSAGQDVTDVSGTATADYIAGTISSSQNGVEVTARVVAVGSVVLPTPISAKVNLTVAGQSLFIRLGTDNQVTKDSARTVYVKKYTALVTDAAGNPVNNVNVQFEMRPAQAPQTAFAKGTYGTFDATAKKWVITGVVTTCFNEDINFNGINDPFISEDTTYNGILDSGEDANRNGILDLLTVAESGTDLNGNGVIDTNEDFNHSGDLTPGTAATATTNIKTDVNGVATTDITYLQNYATWARMTLFAKITVAGTESVSTVSFILPGATSDFADQNTPPPFQDSPFGLTSFSASGVITSDPLTVNRAVTCGSIL